MHRRNFLQTSLHRFYPAGREKLHAMGALDLALWDIKGKALGVPVWQLLGGKSRDHVECYSTGFIYKDGKLWPNERPGLGVTLDTTKLTLTAEFTQRNQPIRIFRRPDGSLTNW